MAENTPVDSLEARLKSHSDSFNSLLSLIPAKLYYGEDTSDQWQRKKQTKEQAKAGKMAKLDPVNAKSAKDVLDEQVANARKRKREEDGEASEAETPNVETPIPNHMKKRKQTKKQKREEKGVPIRKESSSIASKTTDQGIAAKDDETKRKEQVAKRREKRDRKKVKGEAEAAKAKAKKERSTNQVASPKDVKDANDVHIDKDHHEKIEEANAGADIEHIAMEDLAEEIQSHPSPSTATPSMSHSPAFDASNTHSGSSSISSIAPTSTEEAKPATAKDDASRQLKQHKPSPEELQARLAERIEALRAARHPAGGPAKNRQELMEQRRVKEEQRRAHKKDLRRQAKEDEERQHKETLARGSPLLSGTPVLSPGSPLTPSSEANSFTFGRINFPDGQRATSNLTSILDSKSKSKGPSDPRTALLAAQNKQSRLNGLDETKRADITEKDSWLNAKKRAHGERIRDDTSLLKKTLKRKEKQKKKSEKEWNERIEGVKKGQDFRQKKREANLQKRKEEKGGGSKGGKSGSKGAKKGKSKARPGFEGSFRTKAPKSAAADGGNGPRRR